MLILTRAPRLNIFQIYRAVYHYQFLAVKSTYCVITSYSAPLCNLTCQFDATE